MPRHARTLSVGEDNTRHLSAGLMANCFPAADLQRIISECGRASRRVRDLPAVVFTTLMDARKAPALKLAGIYPERWEVELAIREAKEVLRDKQLTLRSKVAELVRQEFWGLLLAHYLVRRTMALADMDRWRNPDTLSFTRSVEPIKSTQAGPVLSFSP